MTTSDNEWTDNECSFWLILFFFTNKKVTHTMYPKENFLNI